MEELIENLKKYFDVREVVCPEVYERFGDNAWYFLDEKILAVLLYIRETIGKPITINTWKNGGQFSQRGLRCNRCDLVKSKKNVYLSAHVLGKAFDCDIKGLSAEEGRKAIAEIADGLPYPIRLERGVNWIHCDCRNYSDINIEYF